MVIKAIINAIGKSKVKPKKFPIGTEKFTKDETQTLLEEAQGKIEKIQSGEIKAVDTGNHEDARAAFAKAQPVIDKATAKGLIHKNKAARVKSRLSAKVKALAA